MFIASSLLFSDVYIRFLMLQSDDRCKRNYIPLTLMLCFVPTASDRINLRRFNQIAL
jgi:hypothetical protein